MRLLTWNGKNELSLTSDLHDDELPPYAILSHTWGAVSDEVTFTDLQHGRGQEKAGYRKIQFCGEQARKDDIKHFWVDTCCINRENLVELSKAITCMFRWYRDAVKCYVYLSDMLILARNSECDYHGDPFDQKGTQLRNSKWFTRGWTLQELLAPKVVEFFSRDKEFLGDKITLAKQISDITAIPIAALNGTTLDQFPIEERIRWTQGRRTTEKEDMAYCLVGIFDVFMPFIYGEGDNAMRRLRKEINDRYGKGVAACLGQSEDMHDHRTRSLGLCLGSAPLIDSSYFVGRAAEIENVQGILRPTSNHTEQRKVVLGGLGGVGKTQLSIAYARHHQKQQHYTSVLWLNATSETTLKASFRSLAKGMIAADELIQLGDERVVARVHEWLSNSWNTKWLLIFDNHDEPNHYSIVEYIPNVGHGSVIITTRLPDLVRGKQVRVQPLRSLQDSLAILQTRSQREGIKDDPGARRLALRLAGLPIALATAGAYLRKTTVTFDQYLQSYERRFDINPRRPTQLQEYQDRTLCTTWDLSYRRLERDDPLAAQLVKLLAYFDNQEMWYELLFAGLTEESPQWLRSVALDRIDFENIMGILVEYAFVDSHPQQGYYSMHSCVHDWSLFQLNRTPSSQLYWYAVKCIHDSIDRDKWEFLGQPHFTRLARHGLRCAHSHFRGIYESDESSIEDIGGFYSIAELLRQQGQLSSATQMYLRALSGYEKTLGPDHDLTLETVNNLGFLYSDQGKLDEAEQMYHRALGGCEKALGAEHHLTLRTLNNLGNLYRVEGKLVEAKHVYDEALVRCEKTLGRDHPFTLDIVHDSAILLMDRGMLRETEEMYRRVLDGYTTALGPYHPSTLGTLNNLGLVHSYRGELDKAEQMYVHALAGYEKAMGPYHSRTLDTVYNLGALYQKKGKLEKAEQMYARVLSLDSKHNIESRQRNAIVGLAMTLSQGVRVAGDREAAVSQLARLIDLLEKWDGIRNLILLRLLMKALIGIKDDENALIVLVQMIKIRVGLSPEFEGVGCDGCQCEIRLATGRYICRVCEDIDLCNTCMASYTDGNLAALNCTAHEFFDAGSKISKMILSLGISHETDIDVWMEEIRQTYHMVEKNGDVGDLSEQMKLCL